MIAFITRRLLLLVPVLLGVTVVTFTLTRIIPGNPIDLMVSPLASAETRERIAENAGLNDPLWVQYFRYIGGVTRGDFGDSFVTDQPVLADLTSRFMPTFELTLFAMLLAVILAVPLGIASAVWRGTWIDHVSRLLAVFGVAMPVFWVSLVAIYVFFFLLNWLPAPQGRIGVIITPPATITGLYTVDALLTGDWKALRSSVQSIVLPASVLAFAAMAPLARMTRASMIEALDADYTRAARALGLSERSVVFRHALRNAILPVITMIAIVYGYLLGGVVLVENVFAWPGLGRYVYNAIASSDYPALQGFILYSTTAYVLLFLLVDILYVILDPRVRI
ncbi:MAG: ABC transporter permease [Paracoccaceae bacterium]|nr:ABC transporter permease [Paracoccaceae bacterium]MDE2912581.1 ABC transporter permease [Paracoccaceae bacterium]